MNVTSLVNKKLNHFVKNILWDVCFQIDLAKVCGAYEFEHCNEQSTGCDMGLQRAIDIITERYGVDL